MATVVLLLPKGKFEGQFTEGRYLLIELCDRNCVILWINRARCALNIEILDLFNKESITGACSGK